MIIFKELDITSFKSIFHCHIDFTEFSNSLYLLEGKNNTVNFAKSNGAGKTTLIDALSYVLYGTTDNGFVKFADYQNKNTVIKLKIVANLEIDNIEYTIERTANSFKLFKQGEDISELTKTDTEKKFLNILGVSKTEFFSFTYISQTNGGFLNKTPSEKLSCIKDFIYGEELKQIQDKITTLIKEKTNKINEIKRKISNIEGQNQTLNSLLSKQQNREIINMTELECENQLQIVQTELKVRKEIEKLIQSEEIKFNRYKSELEKLKEQYTKAVNNICPTCGQALHDNLVIDNIKNSVKNIKQSAIDTADNIKKLKSEISDMRYTNSDLQYLSTTLGKIKSQKENYNIDEIRNSILNNSKDIGQFNTQLDIINLDLTNLTNLQKYFKNTFIQQIQQNFISEVENYLNIYCYDMFNADFKLNFNNNSLELTLGDKPISYYSGGEIQRINLIFLFAIKVALMNLTNKTTNLLILDESLSGSDSEAFENCIELIENLTESEKITTILVSHRDIDIQKNKIIINRYSDKTELNIIQV